MTEEDRDRSARSVERSEAPRPDTRPTSNAAASWARDQQAGRYLAAVSRHLESPLAIVVQSSSAAGKSSLMDAVLAFVPEEERIQYSAMTASRSTTWARWI
jgi:type IV secretory pathway ATPase VirB11/archaellum biosynthesis ATPase